MSDSKKDVREVAFYHRNTSERRKEEVLKDLKLPLNSPDKKLLVVVATVSLGMENGLYQCLNYYTILGVGVDIRVHNSVNLGLSATAEDFFQEGGRPMRGSELETQGQQGFSFFLHKGALGINFFIF